MADDKNLIITGGKKPLIKLPLFLLRRSRLILLLLSLGIMLAAGFVLGGFDWLKRNSPLTKKTPTVNVNGQDIPAAFKTPQFKVKDVPQEPVNYDKLIQDQEAKIAQGTTGYNDYLTLGDLYLSAGNKAKAIESYQKAKQVADPKMSGYQSLMQALDEAIKQLQAGA